MQVMGELFIVADGILVVPAGTAFDWCRIGERQVYLPVYLVSLVMLMPLLLRVSYCSRHRQVYVLIVRYRFCQDDNRGLISQCRLPLIVQSSAVYIVLYH